jgi:hypothetical protein
MACRSQTAGRIEQGIVNVTYRLQSGWYVTCAGAGRPFVLLRSRGRQLASQRSLHLSMYYALHPILFDVSSSATFHCVRDHDIRYTG